MKTWFLEFWNRNGDRLVFTGMSLGLAGILYYVGMKEAAKTILVGCAMLYYNKARGVNGSGQRNPEKVE
jgi:hypothetical protein